MLKTRGLLLVLVLMGACAEPLVTPATAPALATTSSEAPTTTLVTTGSTAAATTDTTAVDVDDMDPGELVELLESLGGKVVSPSLVPGEAIDPPADFPTVDDLAVWSDSFINPGHRRALITSYLGPWGDPVELIAGGMMFEVALGMMITITYFDDITVWDYGDGIREVRAPDIGFVTLGSDGEWTDSGAFEWPAIGPIPVQDEAQTMAAGVLASEGEVVGYERIADVDTIRISKRVAGAGIDVWVNADGVVMRLIYDTGDRHEPATLSYVWNVETLAAELTGPLPPGV